MAIESCKLNTAAILKVFCVTETPFRNPQSGIKIALTMQLIIKSYFYTHK